MIKLTVTTRNLHTRNLQKDTLWVDGFTVDKVNLTYQINGQVATVPVDAILSIKAQTEPVSAPPSTIIVAPRPGAAATARLQAQYGNHLPVDKLVDLAWQQAGYLD